MSDTELLRKSEPVRRLEVFTGAGRRRRWSREQKAQVIAESYGGGESVSAVARRHGLTAQQLFTWRRHARREAAANGSETGLAFAPVMVDHAQTPGAALKRSAVTAPWPQAAIEIEIAGTTIRVPAGADVGTLLAVLCTVKAVS
jgi:transposase